MTVLETVYAIQNFEAENEDELTFQIGEPISILQKDDGYNDGWWKGENTRGDIGLFPMSYTTYKEPLNCQQIAQLPTPSNSDVVMTKKGAAPINLTTSFFNGSNNETRSLMEQSSYSFTCPTGPTTAAATAALSNHLGGFNNVAIRRLVIKALFLPALRSTPPETWNVNQVEIWLNAMDFQSVATNFKCQEITGDILLELNMGSLKELDVPTFGKRYKIHTAIQILRNECGLKNQPKRVSVCSPTCFDDYLTNEKSSHSPEYSISSHTKHSITENTIFMTENKCHKHRKSVYSSNEKDNFHDDDTYQLSPSSYSGSSPLTPTSTVDIADMKQGYFEHLNGDEETFLSAENSNMYTIQQTQYNQRINSANSRSSLDMYCYEETENVSPDMEGWLYKQSCKYKKWNKRWFVLKGPNLFYFKSPKDVRMKGIINLRGYKIVVDETIQPGTFSFKAQHEQERTFFFYTHIEQEMKAWISSLIKATISRDFAVPVLSSSIIPTVSLEVARRMRPRPPSVLLHRKGGAVSKSSPVNSSSSKARKSIKGTSGLINSSGSAGYLNPRTSPDASSTSILTALTGSNSTPHTMTTTTSLRITEKEEEEDSCDSFKDTEHGTSSSIGNDDECDQFLVEEEDSDDSKTLTLLEVLNQSHSITDEENSRLLYQTREETCNQSYDDILSIDQKTFIDASFWSAKEYITWVNTICTKSKICSLKEIRQGDVLKEILQHISGKQVKKCASPIVKGTISMLMPDGIVDAFNFMTMEGIELDDQFTIKDIYSGKEDKIMLLLKSILNWSTSLQD
ncbi:hypothetical protein BDF20DRAFT_832992 [Mycotypha africana]|uniref:uncharacterized protein n=1 Tax=Mycotypha africana TaxID=64632 RepID=UPI0023013F5C|nr:uncharacterized protein BDF20DRAFT_832992 [Mycotypha africana]KAI8988119.1 hypothetical protein BDF20DRAFT_832992 [Mycotypha africana]